MTWSVRRYPEQLHPDSPRGHATRSAIRTPSGRSTRHSRSSHPGWWHILSGYVVRIIVPYSLHSRFAYGKGLQSFGSSWFWAFHCFAMDSKELSSISDCFGDQKAIKTPKLNMIWLELIARVLNILIRLKCDNYYSKVFKRVNYKLSNSTFWVVISPPNRHIASPLAMNEIKTKKIRQ